MPIWQKQAPLFLFLRKENRKMTRFFERGTALAEMERQMMMMAPNFTPRSRGAAGAGKKGAGCGGLLSGRHYRRQVLLSAPGRSAPAGRRRSGGRQHICAVSPGDGTGGRRVEEVLRGSGGGAAGNLHEGTQYRHGSG